MAMFWRMTGIALVFLVATAGWLILGGINLKRSSEQTSRLEGNVAELWGRPQTQTAPSLAFVSTTTRESVRTEQTDGVEKVVRELITERQSEPVSPASTTLAIDVGLDQRLKGLVWYSLYNLKFDGVWTYTHNKPQAGELELTFAFPDARGLYDDFRFFIDGRDIARELRPKEGKIVESIPVKPGQEVTFRIAYLTRGMDDWRYQPGEGVSNIERFALTMTTDFADIDFPSYTMSPSSKLRVDRGWQLDWRFTQLVTGHGMGVSTPQRIQPGELAAQLAFSAPISLMFFFLVLFVLGLLRGIDIHPMNYLLLAGAFFSFHLLFSYSVDHLQVVSAFALSSVVSLVLVVSYLRLAVGARFAFVEAGAAQLIYLVGFSLAHFWDGFTGLTVTVLSILTLFLLMQLTGRLRWSEVLTRRAATPATAPV